jgi:hypothetical protein
VRLSARSGTFPGEHPVHPLAAAVAISEEIVSELGFGLDGEGHAYKWAADALGLSALVRASIAGEAKHLLERIE